MQGHVLATTNSHAELQAIEAIQTAYPFPIHEPTLSSEQHPNALIPKPRPGMSQIPDAQPERRLIFGPTSPIPGGASALGQPTGPRTTHRERSVKPLGEFPTAGGP